jgi:hypothetical protein
VELNDMSAIKRYVELAKLVNPYTTKKQLKADYMNGNLDENIHIAIDIFDTIENYNSGEFIASELEPLVEFLNSSESELLLEIDGMEFRLIADSAIDEIYQESFKVMVQDCYDLKLDELPSFLQITIDWKTSANYVRDCDGYGNHFASYDGEELESSGYYIFRTN